MTYQNRKRADKIAKLLGWTKHSEMSVGNGDVRKNGSFDVYKLFGHMVCTQQAFAEALAATDDMMVESDDDGKGTFHGDFYGGKARPTEAERTI